MLLFMINYIKYLLLALVPGVAIFLLLAVLICSIPEHDEPESSQEEEESNG